MELIRKQYDKNAIRIDNVLHQQIGHLPRTIVEKLAHYIVSLAPLDFIPVSLQLIRNRTLEISPWKAKS